MRVEHLKHLGFVCILSFYTLSAVAQTDQNQELDKIKESLRLTDKEKKEKVDNYLSNNQNLNRRFESNGVVYFLVDITDSGLPIYLKTHNIGAAETVGVNLVRNGGDLGLDLTGEGIQVGVWDGGLIRNTHVEFGGRAQQQDAASSLSNHSTHVTGTILAAGVNSSAQGMAYEAEGLIFDFNNDLTEIAERVTGDQSSLLLSNHSYGTVTGWDFNSGSWQWFGDPSVSTSEDYKFGFYDGQARSIDNICFNAPYYTVVKSAGNDRSDNGDGSRGPDGPFDCISTFATAKNIITVGAIEKITNGYNSPEDAIMSSFSSWGPTDDGRIKPDIVGAGVSIFSSFSSADDAYGSLQGTSMSAPNVTGSLALLQQLAKSINNNYLKSATLKSLIIHTAKEAGIHDGPDYKYGWGVLDVAKAAEILMNDDSLNNMISETTLADQDTFKFEFYPQRNSKVTSSIAWTDVPGTSPEISLDPTDLMLVNDLDMVIIDPDGNEIKPWVLDPANPGVRASKGNNFRDNVEKIEFTANKSGKYTLLVSHKGSLSGSAQDYSLIFTQDARLNPKTENILYFINKDLDGQWSNPNNWSTQSGGASIGMVPSYEDNVIIDSNSFSEGATELEITENVQCKSMVWLSDSFSSLQMNNYYVDILGDLSIESSNIIIDSHGVIFINGVGDLFINSNSKTNKLSLHFNNADGLWRVPSGIHLDSILVSSGSVAIDNSKIYLNAIKALGSDLKEVQIVNSKIDSLSYIDLKNEDLQLITDNSELVFSSSNESFFHVDSTELDIRLKSSGGVFNLIGTGNHIKTVDFSFKNFINGTNSVDSLFLEESTELQLFPNEVLTIKEWISLKSTTNGKITISSDDEATINLEPFEKFCFDDLVIENINISGAGVISAGVNSIVTNSSNWFQDDCVDVLFANFDVANLCANGVSFFNNKSNGDIDNYLWEFGDGNSSDETEPFYTYSQPGSYDVQLTIMNESNQLSYNKIIDIEENSISPFKIIFNEDRLVSEKSSDDYIWFKNSNLLLEENERILDLGNSAEATGEYYVVVSDSVCNRKSEVYNHIVTSYDQKLDKIDAKVFPTPVNDDLYIDIGKGVIRKIVIHTIAGVIIYSKDIDDGNKHTIDTSSYPSGLYLLSIETNENHITKKIIVKNEN